jgi:hypothetical protein
MVRRSESGFYIRARLSGSACDSQTPTSLGGCPFSSGCRSDRNSPRSSRNVKPGLFEAKQCRFVYGQEPHTKSKKNFPLELRAKTQGQRV